MVVIVSVFAQFGGGAGQLSTPLPKYPDSVEVTFNRSYVPFSETFSEKNHWHIT